MKVIKVTVSFFVVVIFVMFGWFFFNGVADKMAQKNNLPKHEIEVSTLEPKEGKVVRVFVKIDITKEQCLAFVDFYKDMAMPNGQVGVNKPSTVKIFEGKLLPWCIENFDGRGVVFSQVGFK